MIEPIALLLAYSLCASLIWSSLKTALMGTESFPSFSHSKMTAKSSAKCFDPRFTPKNVVRFPDQKTRFRENSLSAEGITDRGRAPVHAGRFMPYPTSTPPFLRIE